MSYTKGEWLVIKNIEKQGLNGVAVLDTTVKLICTTVHRKEEESNLKLLSAAPDLLEKCIKISKWLNKLADAAEERGKDTRFITLSEANKADAKNYRATAKDIEAAIKKATL